MRSGRPAGQPARHPSREPSRQPPRQPSRQPSREPTREAVLTRRRFRDTHGLPPGRPINRRPATRPNEQTRGAPRSRRLAIGCGGASIRSCRHRRTSHRRPRRGIPPSQGHTSVRLAVWGTSAGRTRT
ncbi:MAG: hypothetical protein GY701_28930 [Sulfitobacter sp.]|nr:hypothetical protein [Sulfitobacter sp.]